MYSCSSARRAKSARRGARVPPPAPPGAGAAALSHVVESRRCTRPRRARDAAAQHRQRRGIGQPGYPRTPSPRRRGGRGCTITRLQRGAAAHSALVPAGRPARGRRRGDGRKRRRPPPRAPPLRRRPFRAPRAAPLRDAPALLRPRGPLGPPRPRSRPPPRRAARHRRVDARPPPAAPPPPRRLLAPAAPVHADQLAQRDDATGAHLVAVDLRSSPTAATLRPPPPRGLRGGARARAPRSRLQSLRSFEDLPNLGCSPSARRRALVVVGVELRRRAHQARLCARPHDPLACFQTKKPQPLRAQAHRWTWLGFGRGRGAVSDLGKLCEINIGRSLS